MAAFPSGTPTVGSLHEMRDQLLQDAKELAALQAVVNAFVEKIEAQRMQMHVAVVAGPDTDGDSSTVHYVEQVVDDTAYDAVVLPLASALHTTLGTTQLLAAAKLAIGVK